MNSTTFNESFALWLLTRSYLAFPPVCYGTSEHTWTLFERTIDPNPHSLRWHTFYHVIDMRDHMLLKYGDFRSVMGLEPLARRPHILPAGV